jgi:FkbM family methyltransferase
MTLDEAFSGLPEFGYACDVGANDGTFNSNTLLLEERGWLVLCVEPNPLLESAGRSCRKLWRQVACGAKDEESKELIVVGGHPYASSTGLELRYAGSSSTCRLSVKVRTLDRLLEESGFPRLDVLTIDVEGYEGEVLQGFSVERWKPSIILVEDCDGLNPTEKYIPPAGYEELGWITLDRVWKRSPE